MNMRNTYLANHTRTYADDLTTAEHRKSGVATTANHESRHEVPEDNRSFQSLQRAMNILERLVAERGNAIEDQRAEINDVLNKLRVVH
jgi:hypothetical protein